MCVYQQDGTGAAVNSLDTISANYFSILESVLLMKAYISILLNLLREIAVHGTIPTLFIINCGLTDVVVVVYRTAGWHSEVWRL